MADQMILNETPATLTQWFVAWRLFQTLLLAGWTVHYSSDGTTHSAADNWTPAGFSGLGSGAYVILTGPGGRQISLRRSTTSTLNGTIQYAYLGGWGVAGAGPTTIPTAPASAVLVRNNASWFGPSPSTAPVKLNIWANDVSTGDGSFSVVFSTATSWGSGSLGGGALMFRFLEGTEPEDADPYAWWAPANAGGNWSGPLGRVHTGLLSEDNAGGTTGNWKRWHFGGTPAFVNYGSSGDAYNGSGSNRSTANGATWGSASDLTPYAGGTQVILHRIHLVKALQTGRKDPNGGYVKDVYFATPEDVPVGSTIGTAAYAKIGAWLVMPWDGNVANPPVES